MNLRFNLDEINEFDKKTYLSSVMNYFSSNNVAHTWRSYFFSKHYGYRRMFAYLVNQFDNKKIVELGTEMGGGTFALSYNKSNSIITYDNKLSHYGSMFNIDSVENIKSYILPSEGTKTAMGNVFGKTRSC